MKKKIFLTLVLLIAFFSGINAQQLTYPQQQKVNQLFKKSNVVYFKFAVRSMQEIPHFSKILSVDKTTGITIFAHANKQQFSNFIKKNMAYTVLPTPKTKKPAATKPKTGAPAKK